MSPFGRIAARSEDGWEIIDGTERAHTGEGDGTGSAETAFTERATLKMKVSYRQAKRIYRCYLQEGDQGLLHRSQGKASGEAYDP